MAVAPRRRSLDLLPFKTSVWCITRRRPVSERFSREGRAPDLMPPRRARKTLIPRSQPDGSVPGCPPSGAASRLAASSPIAPHSAHVPQWLSGNWRPFQEWGSFRHGAPGFRHGAPGLDGVDVQGRTRRNTRRGGIVQATTVQASLVRRSGQASLPRFDAHRCQHAVEPGDMERLARVGRRRTMNGTRVEAIGRGRPPRVEALHRIGSILGRWAPEQSSSIGCFSGGQTGSKTKSPHAVEFNERSSSTGSWPQRRKMSARCRWRSNRASSNPPVQTPKFPLDSSVLDQNETKKECSPAVDVDTPWASN